MRVKSLIALMLLMPLFATAKSKSPLPITATDLKNLTYTLGDKSAKFSAGLSKEARLGGFAIVPLDQVGVGGYFYEPTAAVVLAVTEADLTKYYLAIVIRDEDDGKIRQAAVTYLGDKEVSSICTRWSDVLVQIESGPWPQFDVVTFRFKDRLLWKAIKQ